MSFTFTIDGLDVSSYVEADGFEWERNDIDAPNAGRDMNGTMRRKILTTKDKLSITCKPITTAQLSSLVAALAPNTVSVTYYCPGTASNRTATFYTSKVQSGIVMDLGTSVLLKDIKFDLIEV